MFQEMLESTGITPKALQSRPELTQIQAEIYNSFVEISRGRNYTMSGPLPVGLQEFMAYSTLYELEPEEAQELWQIVRALDSHWLNEHAKRNPPPSAQKSSKK